MDHVQILKQMISINTSVPPGKNYGLMCDYLEPLFKSVGCETKEVMIPRDHAEGQDGRLNLICHRRSPGKPRLIFYGHIDVVPAAGWNAFEARVDGGKIYGRGAADMKGAIPALLLALEATKDRPLLYDTSVMITTDEEVSQGSQLQYLAQFLQPVAGSAVFDLDSSFGYVSVAGLGALHMTIRVKGKSVHSAMSHTGENAVEKAVLLMDALLHLKREVTMRRSFVQAAPNTGLKQMEARLNINMVSGGLKVNIVPDECLITIDRRLIPEENLVSAQAEIERTLKSVPGVNWEIAGVSTIPSVPPREGPLVDHLADIIRKVTGQTGKYGEMGSGDLAHIVAEWGGTEFGLGVIRPDNNIHGKDEFVYQKDIEDLAKIIELFITG